MVQQVTSTGCRYAANIQQAQEIIGYMFDDWQLLEIALTHPSVGKDVECGNNYERLEFLGDSILGAIIATYLYEKFDDLDEGGLTRIKVSLVSGEMLSKVAHDEGLGNCIIFGESETGTDRRGMHSALENVYESIVAALFLDGGIEAARAWVLRTLGPYADHSLAAEPESPKSFLQEFVQARQMTLEYKITGFSGPPHARTFFAQVSVDDVLMGEGEGRSKKEAEAHAAKDALEKLSAQ